MRLLRFWRTFLVGALLGLLPAVPAAASATAIYGVEATHEVAAGEDLGTIALRYGVAIEHLAWSNGLALGRSLSAGTRLIVPLARILPPHAPRDGIVVNIPERALYLFRQGRLEGFYAVAVGRTDFPTPRGSFRIVSRIKNPTWLPPKWAGLGNIAVGPGPDNPLGEYWMGLSGTGAGLHAGSTPQSIGGAQSHGCLRMYPVRARHLFDLVRVGMPVRIEYQTARLGRSAAGDYCLSAFPDVYGLETPVAAALRQARAAGLSDFFDRGTAQAAVANSGGRPLTVLRAVTHVLLDGRNLAPSGSVVQGGTVWLSRDLLRSLGMAMTWDAARRAIVLSHGAREFRATAWRRLGGQAMIAASDALPLSGLKSDWDAATSTVQIRSVLAQP